MSKVIQHLNGLIEIGDKKYSFKEEMYVCRVRFVPSNNDGWGISKDFEHTTNFDAVFLNEFIEKSKQFL